jgi:hypothetical protein
MSNNVITEFGNISAKKLFYSNADSNVNVRIAMENLQEKISPIKGAALPKTHQLITDNLFVKNSSNYTKLQSS